MFAPKPFSRWRAPAALFALAVCAAGGVAHAQDRLVFKDGHAEEGKVNGMSNGAVLIKVAAGQLSYPLALLSRVDVAPPAAYKTGRAAYQAGEWDKGLAALKPVVDQFKGLPTEWAGDAVASLGDIYLEKNDLPAATATFNDYRTLYPNAPGGALRLNLAQARIAFAQNNFPAAEKQLQALRDTALKHPAQATKGEGAAYGQACYLLGRLEERQDKYQDALQDYLRTVTLFYEDEAVTARAQKSADALRAVHHGLYAP